MANGTALSQRYGWPLKIKARGYIAYLVGVQPLIGEPPAPIYRFPGGDSLVDKREMIPVEEANDQKFTVWIEDWSSGTGTLTRAETFTSRRTANEEAIKIRDEREVMVSVFDEEELSSAQEVYNFVPGIGWQ